METGDRLFPELLMERRKTSSEVELMETSRAC